MEALEMLTPRQAKAGRVLLGIGQEELAQMASVAKRTLMDFESGARANTTRGTRISIATALVDAGLALLDGEGVAFANDRAA